MWDTEIHKYRCDKCEEVLKGNIDNIVQVQFGYLMDEGQSFESHFDRPDKHYHENCYKT